MKPRDPEWILEELVDSEGLARVLDMLGDICYGKAQHLEESWRDTKMARLWTRAGQKLQEWSATKVIQNTIPI